MSDEKAAPRPRQVTTGAVLAVVGSLVLVLSLFDSVSRLRSADTRAAVDDFLTGPGGDALGLDTAQVLDLLRVLSLVSGAMAAAALVFAVFSFQRHRGARIGLTVMAALLVLTLPVAGLMPLLLAAAVVLLWSRPARDWFDGRQPKPATAHALSEQGPGPSPYPYGQRPPGPGDQPNPPPYSAPTPPASSPPPTPSPSGPSYPPASSYPQGQPAPGQQDPYGNQLGQYGQQYGNQYGQYGYGPYGQGPASDPDKRPGTVTAAAILTWIGAGGVLAITAMLALVLAAAGDRFLDEFDQAARSSDMTFDRSDVMAVGWAAVVICGIWSVSAIVLAWFALRRSQGARIGLVVSATMVALFSLLTITSLFTAVTLLMGIATVVLLFTGGANGWYARRSSASPGGYPGGYGGYGPGGYGSGGYGGGYGADPYGYPGQQQTGYPDPQTDPQAGSQTGPQTGPQTGQPPAASPDDQGEENKGPW